MLSASCYSQSRGCTQALRKQKGANFCQALQQIPRNTRTMYVHAYQSRLWNEAASHRVRTFGAKDAVAGDLVVPPDAAEAAPEGALSSVHVTRCIEFYDVQ